MKTADSFHAQKSSPCGLLMGGSYEFKGKHHSFSKKLLRHWRQMFQL